MVRAAMESMLLLAPAVAVGIVLNAAEVSAGAGATLCIADGKQPDGLRE